MWFWRRKGGPESLETYREWLSEAQWQEAVERIRKQPSDFNGPERRDSAAPRHELIRRCLLRVERPGRGVLGMLLVRTLNISATGIRVMHGGRIPRHSRATLVIEAGRGGGLIVEGRVIWCRKVRGCHVPAHEIGVAFDHPIEVRGLVEAPTVGEAA